MTHAEFVAAYRDGKLSAKVDPKAARELVSRRMLLPLMLLPVLGVAVALAIGGAWLWGAVVFAAALVFRTAVRASAPGFVLTRSLEDANFYDEAVRTGILTLYTSP